MSQDETGKPTPGGTPFQRFQDLARRVLTTPKAEALKNEPKPTVAPQGKSRKKGR